MRFINKAVWLEEGILVIADLHIGYEENLIKKGVFLPRMQYKKTIKDLERIFCLLEEEDKKVEKVIILGDLKHEFGSISRQEWKETLDLIDFLKENGKNVILIKGNHDNILNPIVKKKGLEVKEYYIKDDKAFIHGDKKVSLDKKVKCLFLGHLHPAITIKKEAKQETYKCFLTGRWKSKQVVILPSFFPLTEGSDVNFYDTNLDFNFNLKNFNVYVPIENETRVLEFGKVSKVGRLI